MPSSLPCKIHHPIYPVTSHTINAKNPPFLMTYPPVSLKLIVLMSSYGPCINDMCSYHQIPENLHLFIIAAQIILRAVILTCFPFLPLCKNPRRWEMNILVKCSFKMFSVTLQELERNISCIGQNIYAHALFCNWHSTIAPCVQIKFVEIKLIQGETKTSDGVETRIWLGLNILESKFLAGITTTLCGDSRQ